MSSWSSYPKIYNVGHAALAGYFDAPVIIEEKVDGSQFSFGVFDGELKCRSKGQQLCVDAPEKMFLKAVATAQELAPLLIDGWTYRGEFLSGPKHNTLKYNRAPIRNIILFDINTGNQVFLGHEEKSVEANRIGLEVVPKLVEGYVNLQDFEILLDRESILGGPNIEGVVCKRYDVYDVGGKVILAKHVSESFKEVNSSEFRKSNPTSKDFALALADKYRSEARWSKAVQHLRESGALTSTPQDIPMLIQEVLSDLKAEENETITKAALGFVMQHIERGAIRGLPEWYKTRLLESQFDPNYQDAPDADESGRGDKGKASVPEREGLA